MRYEKPRDRQRLRYTELRDRVGQLEKNLSEAEMIISRVEYAVQHLLHSQSVIAALGEQGLISHEGHLKKVI